MTRRKEGRTENAWSEIEAWSTYWLRGKYDEAEQLLLRYASKCLEMTMQATLRAISKFQVLHLPTCQRRGTMKRSSCTWRCTESNLTLGPKGNANMYRSNGGLRFWLDTNFSELHQPIKTRVCYLDKVEVKQYNVSDNRPTRVKLQGSRSKYYWRGKP